MRRQMLITKEIERRAPALYAMENTPATETLVVAKFFTPYSSWSWYMTEYRPEEKLAFGWCDNGQGGAELGYFSLAELEGLEHKIGRISLQAVERDTHFNGHTLAQVMNGEVK